MRTDTQIIELLGKVRLIKHLAEAGLKSEDKLEIAEPVRDKGIDLIIYYYGKGGKFLAKPVQLKAASKKSFPLNKKYSKIPGLLMVYVWGCNGEGEEAIYAMTYDEAHNILKGKSTATNTSSWKNKGYYAATKPSEELIKSMEKYKMETKQDWVKKIKETK